MPPAVKGLVLALANTLVIATANAIAAATGTEVGWGQMTRGECDGTAAVAARY